VEFNVRLASKFSQRFGSVLINGQPQRKAES
jgi:hypothetical protein